MQYPTTSIYSTSSEEEEYYIPSRDKYHHYWNTNQPHSIIPQVHTATTFSTKSPTFLPMTDSSHHQPIDARALHSRLAVIANNNNNNETNAHGSTQRRFRPSLDSTTMRPFIKSSTISTFDSNTSSIESRQSHLHASPSSRLHPESVGIAPGEFSKPRVPKRSRRYTMESSSSSSGRERKEREEQAQFKYYGRHGNQWLFNDFSVTGAVAKGFRRVFGGNKEGRDWYEDREER